MRGEPLFSEIQAFRQPWLWIALFIILFVGLSVHFYGCRSLPVAVNPWLRRMLQLLPVLIIVVVVGFLWVSRLETEVRSDGLFVRFFPLQWQPHRIELQDATCRVATVSPLKNYGGWGLRCGSGGTAYLVSGNSGLRLDFPDGSHVFIGSLRANELYAAVTSIASAVSLLVEEKTSNE